MNSKINLIFLVLCLLLIGGMLGCAPPTPEMVLVEVTKEVVVKETVVVEVEKELAVTAVPTSQVIAQFTSILNPGEWTQEIIVPSMLFGGYVVDITPLAASSTGAYVEHKVIPEFNDRQWLDVLWMRLSGATNPLKVKVQAFSTLDWPIAFEAMLDLNPGEVHDFVIQDAALNGGYAVEIDPLKAGKSKHTFEQALVMQKYSDRWYDVLRIQIPVSQPAISVNVRVYRTPDDLPVQAEFTTQLESTDASGFVLGDSNDRCAYIIEVTPLSNNGNQTLFLQVQPEYDGKDWNDVARLATSANLPSTDVILRIYTVR